MALTGLRTFVTLFSHAAVFWRPLRDIQKTAARETIVTWERNAQRRARRETFLLPTPSPFSAPETYPKKIGRIPKRDQAIYTEKIDIFSLGALMSETIIGHLPERNLPDPVLEG